MSQDSRTVGIRKIYRVDAHTLGIDWTDGTAGKWRLADLRRHCPCASCVNEWTGEQTLDSKAVDEDLGAKHIDSVGRYAIRIVFGDGHDTGIFSYELLRSLSAES